MVVAEQRMKSPFGRKKSTSINWKNENLEIIKGRLSGWQLNSFNKSYEFKLKNGISLIKHKLMNK